MLKRKRSSNTEKTGVISPFEAPIQAAIRAWIEAGFHPVMARAMTGDNPKASLALLAEVRRGGFRFGIKTRQSREKG